MKLRGRIDRIDATEIEGRNIFGLSTISLLQEVWI